MDDPIMTWQFNWILVWICCLDIPQPGSLIRWTYRLKLPDDAGVDRDKLTAARKDMETKFPQSGFSIRDWTDPAPSMRRDAERFTQFIKAVAVPV